MNLIQTHKAGKKNIIFILSLFLILGILHSFVTPLFSPPDEERHYAYCEYIATHKRLPYLIQHDEGVRIIEVTHPPLFYLIGALFCVKDGLTIFDKLQIKDGPGFRSISLSTADEIFPYSGRARSVHIIRLISIFFSAITIFFIYKLVLKIFPAEHVLASAAALFVATNPQFLHISASVTNEMLASTFSTILLCNLTGSLQGCHLKKNHVKTGVLLGCCLLTKISTAIFIPVIVAVVFWNFLRGKDKIFTPLAIIATVALSISGWWYLRNYIFFDDPFFSKALASVIPFTLRTAPLTIQSVFDGLKIVFVSFFGFFGALQIPINTFHIAVYSVFTLFGIVGMCRLLCQKSTKPFQKQALWLLFMLFLLALVMILLLNIKSYLFMGKYLFMVMAPVSILVCSGVYYLWPLRFRKLSMILILCLFASLTFFSVFRVLMPAYDDSQLVSGVEQEKFCCLTPDLDAHNSIGQTFIAPRDDLCAIRVMFGSKTMHHKGEIVFVLKELGKEEKIICRMNTHITSTSTIRVYFAFPPIPNSSGKTYKFSFFPGASKQNGIYLFYENKDCYPNGNLVENGRRSAGDLLFTTYHFTGEKPRSAWHGVKPTVINQGEYISIRDLQLYFEMSEKLKKISPIQKKLDMYEGYLRHQSAGIKNEMPEAGR